MRRPYPHLLSCLALASCAAQDPAVELLLRRPGVRRALEYARAREPETLERQIALCEIAAPPFEEKQRAAAYKDLFLKLGLQNVRIDAEGNVLGERPGRHPRPHLVFSAHLDTVFPPGTDVRVTRQGSVLKGPGIGDDCRGLAVVAAVAEALQHAKVDTEGSITFVATVGEEGLGDLRGVKRLFRETLEGAVDRFVSVDGTGLGITNTGVGSNRYRVTFRGPGGHSYGAFGMPSPIHALGRAIARIAEIQVPAKPKTTYNVGRVGGGTSVNSIAFDAWMEVDLRSSDAAALQALDERFRAAVDRALGEENRRAGGRGALTVEKKIVGARPAARQEESSPIVRQAIAITRALGGAISLREGSTDANIPMSLSIPALTIGGGGSGAGAHSLAETFDTRNSWKGAERALLLAIALAGK
jgi:acetylornithine deacetylase/succinyl-diaminopimelate desuccinylase-like protein